MLFRSKDLVNAVLRNFLRQQATLLESLSAEENPTAYYAHPNWLRDKLQQAWPKDWQAILGANNQQAPMSLRVNQQKTGRDAYLNKLTEKKLSASALPHVHHGIQLASPTGIEQLPEFGAGEASVQDGAAQLAAELLQTKAGERILDACAAPGGKTAHILESQPRSEERRVGKECML